MSGSTGPVPSPGVALVARGLAKAYDGGLVVAVRRADLDLAPGEWVAITGPTGCGKSTLLSLLGLLEPPDAGEIAVDGLAAGSIRSPEAWRLANVGIVFQLHFLLPHLTVAENLAVPLMATGLSARERQDRVSELLERLRLAHRSGTLAARLSGGERQLVALGRALVNRPRLVFADEPTGAVDSATGALLLGELFSVARTPRPTILLVTHDPAVARRADRVVTMRDGILDGGRAARAGEPPE